MATMTSAETRETTSLIGSDKVEGTAVYGADHEKIGSIERVMIDKISGKVAYAVLSFGGFLGNLVAVFIGTDLEANFFTVLYLIAYPNISDQVIKRIANMRFGIHIRNGSRNVEIFSH